MVADAHWPRLHHRLRLVVRRLARFGDHGTGGHSGLDHRRRRGAGDCPDLCRNGGNVSRARWHGPLCPLLTWLAGRLHGCMGELDFHCVRHPDRGNCIDSVHGILALSLGSGAGRERRTDNARSVGERGTGARLLRFELLGREAVREDQLGHHDLQADRTGPHGGRLDLCGLQPGELWRRLGQQLRSLWLVGGVYGSGCERHRRCLALRNCSAPDATSMAPCASSSSRRRSMGAERRR